MITVQNNWLIRAAALSLLVAAVTGPYAVIALEDPVHSDGDVGSRFLDPRHRVSLGLAEQDAYALTDGVSLALGYQRTDADVTLERSTSEANSDARLDGLTFTFAYAF